VNRFGRAFGVSIVFDGSRWTKNAALILNVQGLVEHSKSAIFSAAFHVQREIGQLCFGNR
jgi:hypothetical protein